MALKTLLNQLPLGKPHVGVCFLGNQPKEIGARSGFKEEDSKVWPLRLDHMVSG